jgi:D-aspartate ligase
VPERDRGVATPDASTPVVVLKLSEDSLAHGALGVIRSLGRLGVPVHVLSMGDWRALEHSRYAVGGRTLDKDATGADLVAALLDYASRFDRKPVLFCVGDASAMAIAADADALAASYLFPRSPDGVVARLADKSALPALCAEHRVPTARTFAPATLADALGFADEVGYPIMLKGADPRHIQWSAGQVSVAKVADAHALRRAIGRDDDDDGGVRANALLQEYIPGGSDSIWFFHGYFDERSTCLAGFVGQKLREHPPGAGATTLAVCRANDEVRASALRLLQGVGYRGIVDAEFRYDAKSDRYLAIDTNPRIGANFRLFVGRDGTDVARMLYLDLTGQRALIGADATVPEGRKLWVESYDPATWRSYYGARHGRTPWRKLPGSLVGVREVAWLALDDPLPFLVMLKRRAAEVKARKRLPRT